MGRSRGENGNKMKAFDVRAVSLHNPWITGLGFGSVFEDFILFLILIDAQHHKAFLGHLVNQAK